MHDCTTCWKKNHSLVPSLGDFMHTVIQTPNYVLGCSLTNAPQ